MYYEISIALNGHHFFATAERSITDRDKLDAVYKALRAAFKEADGYSFYVTRREEVGHMMVEGLNGELRPINQPDD